MPDSLMDLGMDTAPAPQIDTPQTTTQSSYPDGFDENTYDLSAKAPKLDAISQRLKSSLEEKAKYEAQVKDLRRIISKGKAPDDDNEYKNYKPDEKYSRFVSDDSESNAPIVEMMAEADMLSKDAGLNIEQNKVIKDFLLRQAEKRGLIDPRSEIEIEDWRNNQLAVVGGKEKAMEMAKSSLDFFNNRPEFNADEKKAIQSLITTNPYGITMAAKLAKMFGPSAKAVPVYEPMSSGQSSPMAYATEYNDPKTTASRRLEIVQKLSQMGVKMPIVKK